MNQVNSSAVQYSFLKDLAILVKFKLSLMVILSSALSYVILAKDQFYLSNFLLLILGGSFITFAANAMNQCLERDYDKLMVRTALRPVADGRMSIATSVLISGIFCTLGVLFLVMINPIASLLGMLSFVLYSFVYTPMKRFSTLAIPIGAIPGALPILIAGVAASNGFTWEAFCLFGIQYLWQFPHFWSIAWLGHSDYRKAGFKLVNDIDGKPDSKYGLYAAIYAGLSFVFLFWLAANNALHILPFIGIAVCILFYIYFSWKLFVLNNEQAARKLMFCSIIYLPVLLFLLLTNSFIH